MEERTRVEPRRVTPLKLALTASGYTTQEIANRIGVHATVLSRWAGGHRSPKIADALKLSMELGKPVEELWPQHAPDREVAA